MWIGCQLQRKLRRINVLFLKLLAEKNLHEISSTERLIKQNQIVFLPKDMIKCTNYQQLISTHKIKSKI